MASGAAGWRDALMRLHVSGWNTDDIDAACEALVEAVEERGVGASDIAGVSSDDVRRVLKSSIPPDEISALRVIASLRASADPEAGDLQTALYDLDAFAYAYAGDD